MKPNADNPVFFMHIAKTAGSFLNERFVAALGESLTSLHVEHWLSDFGGLQRKLDAGMAFFSGHVMLGRWDMITRHQSRQFRMVTIVREPVEHLASHILWLDHYNDPENRVHYDRLDEAHRRVVDRIGALNICDTGQLDAYLTSLSGIEMRLFDNCQARYFLTTGQRDHASIRPLTLDDRIALGVALRRFDVVARQNHLETDLPRMGQVLGISLEHQDVRVNSGRSLRRINTDDPFVRKTLEKRTLLDQWLWRTANATLSKENVLA
ncbi:MAG: hypothetical protein GKR98_10520 [Boseongicola sp.]|nr:MAG: hypothetical protein GKR98_10520 [Boseongicola sp.]